MAEFAQNKAIFTIYAVELTAYLVISIVFPRLKANILALPCFPPPPHPDP